MPKAPSILKLCKDPAKATVGKFYEFKNATDTSVDLYFYGDIVSDWWGTWQEEDQYPEAIKNFLAEAGGKDLNIYINSGGGSVFAGIAIYNMLKRYTGKKTVCVDALAGSIASVIAFADSDMPTIPLIIEAALVYAKANFGNPENHGELMAAYDMICTKIKGGGYHRSNSDTVS